MEIYVKTVIVLTVVSHHFGDMLIVWSNDRCMPPTPYKIKRKVCCFKDCGNILELRFECLGRNEPGCHHGAPPNLQRGMSPPLF